MNNKTLFIYKSPYLFKILDEIKRNLNFEIQQIDEKELKEINFDKLKNYLIISSDIYNNIKHCLTINNLPEKITKLVEKINISFLRNQFNNQSELRIGKYILDLNSRKIICKGKNLNLTEKETNLIVFINLKKIVNLKDLQKEVWGYSSDLETHTVETHIYRLRKKMDETFKDVNFITHGKKGYYLS